MTEQLLVRFPDCITARAREHDLRHLIGFGCDQIVQGIAVSTARFMEAGLWSSSTAYTCLGGVKSGFISWLIERCNRRGEEITFNHISRELLEDYVEHLKAKHIYQTADASYKKTIQMLIACQDSGFLKSVSAIRPANPFPDTPAHLRHAKPYSARERKIILSALSADLAAVRAGSFEGSYIDELVVYYLLIQLRTGFNSGALLALSRSALIDHPLRDGYKLLVAYKERAKRDVSVPVKWHKEFQDSVVCGDDVASLYIELLSKSEDWWKESSGLDRAFIRPPLQGGKDSGPVEMTLADTKNRIHKFFAQRYKLEDDQGRFLVPSGKRLRATLASRVFELSDGDALMVARVLGNTASVTQTSYVECDDGAESKFSGALDAFVEKLSRSPDHDAHKTPLGACTDPLGGRYAPKDGIKYCERWLHCFKCPNQCLTGDKDDLWRLYSFYWLLQRKSQLLRRTPVSGLLRFVTRVIDGPITEKFGSAATLAKERARTSPHPFWMQGAREDWLNVE